MSDHDYKNGGWKDKYVIFKRCKDCDGTGHGPCTCEGRDGSEEQCKLLRGHKCVTCGGDGRIPVDPKAVYFVLRLDEDPHAVRAAKAYAHSVREENAEFADAILAKLQEIAEGNNENRR